MVGLPPGEAVGTAFVFAGVLRLIAAPFYLFGEHIHFRYPWLMVPPLLTRPPHFACARIRVRDSPRPFLFHRLD
jgi:hypothetical protein